MLINRALFNNGYSNFSLIDAPLKKKRGVLGILCCPLRSGSAKKQRTEQPKDCIKREQYYMNIYKPEYNVYQTAGSPRGYKHTEEALVKLRNRKDPLFLLFIIKKGGPSEEAKLLISKIMKTPFFGRTGEKHPFYNKPRVEGSGRPTQRLEVFDNLTNQKTVYDSMGAAALALNIRVSSISMYFSENRKTLFRKRYL